MYTIYIYETQQYMDRSACFLNTANFRVVVYFDYTRCVNYTNKYIYTPKIGTYERIQHCCKQNSNRELIHEILHLKVKSMNITGYTSARHRVSEILTFSCWWQTYYTYDPLPLLWICFIFKKRLHISSAWGYFAVEPLNGFSWKPPRPWPIRPRVSSWQLWL